MIHRANSLCSSPDLVSCEKDTVCSALKQCDYPEWCLKEALNPRPHRIAEPTDRDPPDSHISIPYVNGTSEAVRRVCSKKNIRVSFKAHRTLKNYLVKPKDKTADNLKLGVVYLVSCECGSQYVGETGKNLNSRIKNHKDALRLDRPQSSAIATHVYDTGHNCNFDSAEVISKDNKKFSRLFKEALFIKSLEPSMNRNKGLPINDIWTPVIKQCTLNPTIRNRDVAVSSQYHSDDGDESISETSQ